MEFIRSVDWWILNGFAEITQQQPWVALFVAVVAEFFIVVPFLVLYLLWRLHQPASAHHSNQKAVIMAIMVVFLALASKSLAGFLMARERPFIANPEFFHLPLQVDPVSFPSGHTLIAFAIAFSLWHSGIRKVGKWLIMLAALIAIGRVAAGVHYPTDIIGGIIIALLCSYYLHREASSLRKYLPNH
jgi:undecaprenyl-diphosphatase